MKGDRNETNLQTENKTENCKWTKKRKEKISSRELWILLETVWTHPASVQLHFERFWFRCWRRLNFKPALTGFHSLLTLLIQTIEGQNLQETQTHLQHLPPFTSAVTGLQQILNWV